MIERNINAPNLCNNERERANRIEEEEVDEQSEQNAHQKHNDLHHSKLKSPNLGKYGHQNDKQDKDDSGLNRFPAEKIAYSIAEIMDGLRDKFTQSARLNIIRDFPFEPGGNQLGDDTRQHGINDHLRIRVAVDDLMRRAAKHGRP